MVGFLLYWIAPLLEPVASRDLTTLLDSSSATSPNTTCLPSSQEVTTVVMKNWEPFLQLGINVSVCDDRGVQSFSQAYVFGPALAMDSRKGRSCFSLKFSSGNFSP
jgi:hypothetical protein